MSPKSVREKSIEKIKLLRDPLVSAAFRHYFQRNWEAKRMLDELRSAGADIERLREWALYSLSFSRDRRARGKTQTPPDDASSAQENARGL